MSLYPRSCHENKLKHEDNFFLFCQFHHATKFILAAVESIFRVKFNPVTFKS